MALEPPSMRPRGTGIDRPPVLSWGSEAYSQFTPGRLMKRAKLIGTCDSRCVLPPASSSRTRKRPFSVRGWAGAEPADPAPTMMKSTVRWSIAASPPIHSAATCANDTTETSAIVLSGNCLVNALAARVRSKFHVRNARQVDHSLDRGTWQARFARLHHIGVVERIPRRGDGWIARPRLVVSHIVAHQR